MPLLTEGSYSKVQWVYLQESLQPGRKEVYPAPHVFVTDEAFTLRGVILRPDTVQTDGEKWVQEISCECSFGITTSQSRLNRRVLCASEKVRTVKATCMLCSFLRWEDGGSVPVPAVPAEPLLSARVSEQLESTMPSEASAIRERFSGCFGEKIESLAEACHISRKMAYKERDEATSLYIFVYGVHDNYTN